MMATTITFNTLLFFSFFPVSLYRRFISFLPFSFFAFYSLSLVGLLVDVVLLVELVLFFFDFSLVLILFHLSFARLFLSLSLRVSSAFYTKKNTESANEEETHSNSKNDRQQ
jgi:hypothetical protein